MSKNYTSTNSTSRVIFIKAVKYIFDENNYNNSIPFNVNSIFDILSPLGFDKITINRFIKELEKTNVVKDIDNNKVKLNRENFNLFLKVKINKAPYAVKQYLNSLSQEEYNNLLDLEKPFGYKIEKEDSPKDEINIPPQDSSSEKSFEETMKEIEISSAKIFSDLFDKTLGPETPIEITDPFENIVSKNTDSFSEDFDKFLIYVKSLEDLTEKLLKENQDLKTKLETSDSHLTDLSRQMNNFGMKIKQREYIPSNVLVMNS